MANKVVSITKLNKVKKEVRSFDENGTMIVKEILVDNLFLVTFSNGDSIALTKEQIEESKLTADAPINSKKKEEKIETTGSQK